ncbi:MAG: hypothetical protein JNM28_04520 [Armatimonadetes bacterium]|nr:hypothetical protein [Armatimonadota bacterium]MBS1712560.1 hypothetical protein [Armatimonadota bacterium]MBX3109131.1 hypothetical protein [Fimbriimonadaceae bacterium]
MKQALAVLLLAASLGAALCGCAQAEEAPQNKSADVAKDIPADQPLPPGAAERTAAKQAETGVDPNDPSSRGRR